MLVENLSKDFLSNLFLRTDCLKKTCYKKGTKIESEVENG